MTRLLFPGGQVTFDNSSEPSARRHITHMLEELADLADEFDDPKLSDIAFRLRVIAMETGAPPTTH